MKILRTCFWIAMVITVLSLIEDNVEIVLANTDLAISDWKLPLPAGKYVITQSAKGSDCAITSRSHCNDYRTLRCAIDIDLPSGEIDGLPLLSPYPGKILDQGYEENGAGYYLYIEHSDGFISHYQHLRRARLATGTDVETGTCVGYVGKSGSSTGSHLHFVIMNKSRTDCVDIGSIDGNNSFQFKDVINSTNQQKGTCPEGAPSTDLPPNPPLPPPSSENHPPNRPSLIRPYNWFETTDKTIELCAKDNGDPDNGDYVSGYFFQIYESARNWDSGWVNSSCVLTTPLDAFTYKWHVKVRDTRGGESDWSEDWNFTVREGSSETKEPSNHPPNPPLPTYPDDWEEFQDNAPQLCVKENGDPDAGDYVAEFRFEIYESAENWDSGWVPFSCISLPRLSANTYKWHSKVRDNHNAESSWSEDRHFTIRSNSPPYPPTLSFPPNGWQSQISPIFLCVQENGDPDNDRVVGYRVEIFEGLQTWDSGWMLTACVRPPALAMSRYKWHAKVKADNGLESEWSEPWIFTLSDLPPELTTGQIAYIEQVSNEKAILKIMNLDGSESRILVEPYVNSFSWSPDGRRIIYSTGHSLMSLLLDTGEIQTIVAPEKGFHYQLLGTYSTYSNPIILPDNRTLLFHVNDGRASGDSIRKLDLLTNKMSVILGPTNFQSFTVSPINGDVLVAGCGGGREGCDLDLLDQNGNVKNRLFDWRQGLYFGDLSWSPDGATVAFSAPDQLRNYLQIDRDIYLFSMDLGEFSIKTGDEYFIDEYPIWSPDGKWIAFSRREKDQSNSDIWIISFSGESLSINLTNTPDVNEIAPSFRPGMAIYPPIGQFTVNVGYYEPIYLTYDPDKWQPIQVQYEYGININIYELIHKDYAGCKLLENHGRGAPDYWIKNVDPNRLIGNLTFRVESWTDARTSAPVLIVYQFPPGEVTSEKVRIELSIGENASSCIQDAEEILVLSEGYFLNRETHSLISIEPTIADALKAKFNFHPLSSILPPIHTREHAAIPLLSLTPNLHLVPCGLSAFLPLYPPTRCLYPLQ